jgi:2-polyprenyl-6-methoxyphenol hydroxylase-like FAD-dependent oxidoreductase
MLAALPADTIEFGRDVAAIDDHGDGITLSFTDGSTVETPVLIGADGIESIVRRTLWGDSPKREHNLSIIGGYVFETDFPGIEPGEAIISHNRTEQGSYTAIRMDGVDGYQWWVLRAWDAATPHPEDLEAVATKLGGGFPEPLPSLIAATPPEQIQRWQIRDRMPLKAWSKGRITLAGDAAHATSPYAAYGAGMSICDGYFLGQRLAGVDLQDTAAVTAALVAYETPRIPHTTEQVQAAYMLGKVFHHIPAPLRPLRDLVMDHTPLLQKQVGERNPREIVAQLDEMGDGILSPATPAA